MKINEIISEADGEKPGFFSKGGAIDRTFGKKAKSFPMDIIGAIQAKTGMAGPADHSPEEPKKKTIVKKKPTKKATSRAKVQKGQLLPNNLESLGNLSSFSSDKGIYTWHKDENVWRNTKGDILQPQPGWREFQKAHKEGKAVVAQKESMGESVLLEGGNIFKDPQTKEPVTKRIARADVDPTLAWVEKITGIPHRDFKLGSTGIRSTSGDLDVAVNQAEVDKEELYQKLVAWAQKNHPDDDVRQWVAKSGINVHFKTPINGDESQGYVQTDLMFGDPEFMKFALKGMGDDTPFKGADRMILIASVAKAKGMKWSPTNGLVNRETNEPITKVPNEVAELILGKGSTAADMDSVERMIEKLKTQPDFDALIADFKDNIEKRGIQMPEDYAILDMRKLAGI